jgi:peptide deformylase
MSKQIKFIDGQMIECEVLPLVDQYDPILRKPTTPVDFDVHDVPYLAMSLMESCNHYQGLGLAAPQIGLPYSLCAVADLDNNKTLCLINPTIVEMSSETSDFKEGCLSFPGLFLKIHRPQWVVMDFQALNGEAVRQKFEGIMATCVLHEFDHLRGICYTDLVSPITLDKEKRKIKTNLKKIKRATTEGIEIATEKPKKFAKKT